MKINPGMLLMMMATALTLYNLNKRNIIRVLDPKSPPAEGLTHVAVTNERSVIGEYIRLEFHYPHRTQRVTVDTLEEAEKVIANVPA